MKKIKLFVIIVLAVFLPVACRFGANNATGRANSTQSNNGSTETTTPNTFPTNTGPAPESTSTAGSSFGQPIVEVARQKIKHIVIIMQENRSFDTYFGTYPGADGIPMQNGVPTVCATDPTTQQCIKPYYNQDDINAGGPHSASSAKNDINNGKMDGFLKQFRVAARACINPDTPGCVKGAQPDVMGWHDARQIPNYWAYAKNFVLQDKMFEPNSSWSLPSHLFMVSAWSADCLTPGDPNSCTNALDGPTSKGNPLRAANTGKTDYAWTDLTYLMFKNNVTWGYYLSEGTQPDCSDDAMLCQPFPQARNVPGIWNPLPAFDTVKQDNQLGNIQTVDKFLTSAKDGSLPAVSWVVPENKVSEHPPARISTGQAYVTSLVNAVMQGPDWDSTVIFISWDDWGGFYDHVVPPSVDQNGYGLRVPGLVISPFAKKGLIDHQILSFDAYLKLIEDIFLGSQRLDPKTDGRPDPRPTVRENAAILGNLLNDLDFNQTHLPPLILPINPPPGPASIP